MVHRSDGGLRGLYLMEVEMPEDVRGIVDEGLEGLGGSAQGK